MSERYIVPAVVNAMNILKYFVERKEGSLNEIAENCQVNKSSCFRILKTLDFLGYIIFDGEKNMYRMGHNFSLLSSSDVTQRYKSIAEGYLEEVSSVMEDSCGLLERSDFGELEYVAKNQIENSIYINIGKKVKITTGAHGKCFMAGMSEEELGRVIRFAGGLQATTKNTITDMEALKQELESVKKAGYAISFEETVKGVAGLSAPIYDPKGKIIFALTCLSIANQTNKRELKKKGVILKEIADKITAQIKESLE